MSPLALFPSRCAGHVVFSSPLPTEGEQARKRGSGVKADSCSLPVFVGGNVSNGRNRNKVKRSQRDSVGLDTKKLIKMEEEEEEEKGGTVKPPARG